MIVRTLITLSLIALLGVVLGFASAETSGRRVRKVQIEVKDEARAGFLDPSRLADQLGTNRLEGELLVDVDLQSVVTHLEALDACAQAEVYPHMDGTLHIDVWQRRPVMRVHVEGGEDHYLDGDGERMALDPHHTPHLPVMPVTRPDQAKMGLQFVNDTRRDAFWNNLTDQLSVNDQGELVLHPRLSGHHIVLGDGSEAAHKKRNLLTFYRAQIERGNLRNYKRIDLTYRDQVIAQRYP